MTRTLSFRWLLLGAMCVVAPACGKRGAPLPPLRPAPDHVTNFSVVRRDPDITISFMTPIRNADGTEPLAYDRVEIYALTVQAGVLPPPLNKIVQPQNRIAVLGQQPSKPAPVKNEDGTTAEPEPPVAIPVTFTENAPIAPAAIVLQANPINPSTLPGRAAPAVGAVAAPAQKLDVTSRFYVVVPYTGRSRMGVITETGSVQLGALPKTPAAPTIKVDEQDLILTWAPGSPGVNVYNALPVAAPVTASALPMSDPREKAGAGFKPMNAAPISGTEFKLPVVFGTEVCFSIRAVQTIGTTFFESAATQKVCETPRDTFPPPAPSNLAAIPTDGAISLTWDAVTATDLAGYLVLRGEGADGTLQPLMTSPVTTASFSDSTAKAGVKYTYAVVAVDTAKNRSKESNRVEETGR